MESQEVKGSIDSLIACWHLLAARATLFRFRGFSTLEAIEANDISNLFLWRELRVPLRQVFYLQVKTLTASWTH